MKRTALIACALLLAPLGFQDPDSRPSKGPEVGAVAPGFQLNDHHGNVIRVGGAAATWTVLAFYPKAATPG